MSRLIVLTPLLFLVSCGPSLEEKQKTATITCNILGASKNMDAVMRLKEVNEARDKIKADAFLGTDSDIKLAFKYDLCKELILDDPEYNLKLKERIKITEEEELKRSEERRIAKEKAAEERRIAEEKAAEERRIAEEKAAEKRRIFNQEKTVFYNILEKNSKEALLGFKLEFLRAWFNQPNGSKRVRIHYSCNGMQGLGFYGNIEIILTSGITFKKLHEFNCRMNDSLVRQQWSGNILFDLSGQKGEEAENLFNKWGSGRVDKHIKRMNFEVEGLNYYRSSSYYNALNEFLQTKPKHYDEVEALKELKNCGRWFETGFTPFDTTTSCLIGFEQPLSFTWSNTN